MAQQNAVNEMDIGYCRADFPALSESVNGNPLVFLDSAASAQKPQAVIDAMSDVMRFHYANVHRGLYRFSQMTTAAYEGVRGKVADFINAASEHEIVFTRNSTESINLVAQSWGAENLRAGDEIILTEMEHHANIVPWQLLAKRTGCVIRVIPMRDDGTLDLAVYQSLLSEKTKMVSFVHISNGIGTINPAQEIVRIAKTYNPSIRVLVDASQSVVHGAVDVQSLGADFIVFTGHKIYGPTGAGILWGRYDVLESMPPFLGGGDMIERVSFKTETTFKAPPVRFEAGTPSFVDIIGLGVAIDYVRTVGLDAIAEHEHSLMRYAMEQISQIDGITVYGPEDLKQRGPIISFTTAWAHSTDVAMILDQCGVAVRTGHHCCMPLMERLGIDGTLRASFALYNTREDVDALMSALRKAKDMLS